MGKPLVFDLAGQKFGYFTVLKRIPGNKWLCRCDCGTEKSVYGGSLRGGRSKSCGCHNRAVSSAKAHDLTDRRVGRLIVIEKDVQPGYWRCRCDCGSGVVIKHRALIKEETKSCGCLKPDVLRVLHRTHGKTAGKRSAIYRCWANMIQRCHNPNAPRLKDYGGRGILVCDRWRYSFEAFYSDMGDPPSENHSIDRIDNDRGYEPGNCRWATPIEQRHNQRRMKL